MLYNNVFIDLLLVQYHIILRMREIWFEMLLHTIDSLRDILNYLLMYCIIVQIVSYIISPIKCRYHFLRTSYCIISLPDGSKYLGIQTHSVVSILTKLFNIRKQTTVTLLCTICCKCNDYVVRPVAFFSGQVSFIFLNV
jgi:hypothetical protein